MLKMLRMPVKKYSYERIRAWQVLIGSVVFQPGCYRLAQTTVSIGCGGAGLRGCRLRMPPMRCRTARRLPAAPPAVAAGQIARRAALRFAARLAIAGVVALIALLGVAGVLGAGGRLARLFGDGGSGLSRGLLTIQLLAKPLWHSV